MQTKLLKKLKRGYSKMNRPHKEKIASKKEKTKIKLLELSFINQ